MNCVSGVFENSHCCTRILVLEIVREGVDEKNDLFFDFAPAVGGSSGIIEARASDGQNGAVWQRRFIERHGRDLFPTAVLEADHDLVSARAQIMQPFCESRVA